MNYINNLIHGDCLEIMKQIEDKSIDMILCDLPYGTTKCKWDVIIPFDKLWLEYERIIKDDGAIVLFGSDPFTSLLITSNLKLFKYKWNWNKVKPTGFQMANYRPMKVCEEICVFSKSPATFVKNKKSMKYNPQGLFDCERVIKASKKSIATNNGGDTTKTYIGKKSGFPNDILEFYNNDKNRLHDTQKPINLIEYLIKTYTSENDLVLDNCIGSGTTAIGCINTNRNYIGIEMDETYYNVAKDRINTFIVENKLDDTYELIK